MGLFGFLNQEKSDKSRNNDKKRKILKKAGKGAETSHGLFGNLNNFTENKSMKKPFKSPLQKDHSPSNEVQLSLTKNHYVSIKPKPQTVPNNNPQPRTPPNISKHNLTVHKIQPLQINPENSSNLLKNKGKILIKPLKSPEKTKIN